MPEGIPVPAWISAAARAARALVPSPRWSPTARSASGPPTSGSRSRARPSRPCSTSSTGRHAGPHGVAEQPHPREQRLASLRTVAGYRPGDLRGTLPPPRRAPAALRRPTLRRRDPPRPVNRRSRPTGRGGSGPSSCAWRASPAGPSPGAAAASPSTSVTTAWPAWLTQLHDAISALLTDVTTDDSRSLFRTANRRET